MARMQKKGDLPTKTCLACGLDFNWRKKWARDWDNIRFCSKRCKTNGQGRTKADKTVHPEDH
ncbi:MAG: DUF2256 domain-containing protein [Alphaproteobacteria bacterium]|nr:DUF2256 domain-containing protein [Alphaproteobacteria bacterium]